MKSRSVDQEKVAFGTAPKEEPPLESTPLAPGQANAATVEVAGVPVKITAQQPLPCSSKPRPVSSDQDDGKFVEMAVHRVRQSRPLRKRRNKAASSSNPDIEPAPRPLEYEDRRHKKFRVFSADPNTKITLVDLAPDPSTTAGQKGFQSSV